ncbi:MAG TPA: hypothetical protein PKX40_02915 [Spirochaetota bacterium]|nr:hypothetical protein [Spirochaetota bacterium]
MQRDKHMAIFLAGILAPLILLASLASGFAKKRTGAIPRALSPF